MIQNSLPFFLFPDLEENLIFTDYGSSENVLLKNMLGLTECKPFRKYYLSKVQYKEISISFPNDTTDN